MGGKRQSESKLKAEGRSLVFCFRFVATSGEITSQPVSARWNIWILYSMFR
jgi:hypothetical protein